MEQKATAYLFCVIILLCLSFDCCRCEDAASSFSSQESGSHKKNSTGSRYCGNSLVRAMRLICDGYYAEPSLKRSLDYSYDSGQPSQPKRRINRKYKIWKRRFNLQDNDLSGYPTGLLLPPELTRFSLSIHSDLARARPTIPAAIRLGSAPERPPAGDWVLLI